ncbi:type III secretion system export apparatus subunit SctS [Paraburkholderia bonniea]|uniref:type III secretion system export apparatus subunit SctS n=1 Tax=Paraburkholderia bonniea TaxID=2152891 RepID=UPI0012908BD6|nr:type III secretion system export apparatus subunit SctS [Paraburkholderia bonniea]WJF89351.1 type III secretion system export apparatus subunit SctS [Paraburkholderia bonniea]WJF92666.1 type III secretion system export apparatus subunit SctS [Paraburkholderia bonniea]
MNYDALTHLTTQALTLCLLVSLPAVAIAACSGLAIAFLQAITSLQDASIGQSVKLVVVTLVVVLSAPWGAAQIQNFAHVLLQVMFA